MATAILVREVREVVKHESVEQVVLRLDTEEAEALILVLAQVGGDPDTTARGLIENIYNALAREGVDRDGKAGIKYPFQGQRRLYFDTTQEV